MKPPSHLCDSCSRFAILAPLKDHFFCSTCWHVEREKLPPWCVRRIDSKEEVARIKKIIPTYTNFTAGVGGYLEHEAVAMAKEMERRQPESKFRPEPVEKWFDRRVRHPADIWEWREKLFKEEPTEWNDEIVGYSEDILPWYTARAEEFPIDATIVEVGCYHGRSVLWMAKELVRLGKVNSRIFAVDTWDWDPADFPSFLMNLAERLPEQQAMIRPIRGESNRAAHIVDNDTVDLVFIDGEHDEYHVREDILAWAAKIRNGGVLSGHDYTSQPGVKLVVDHLFSSITLNQSVWSVRREGSGWVPA